jgi:hypothetical protein
MSLMKRIEALIVVIVIIAVGALLFATHHSSNKVTPLASSGCASEVFSVGSSGNCVQDIQTMVDYMETDDLTECPFTGGQVLPVDGSFDASTKQQVQVVQTWQNCYNKQEDLPAAQIVNGSVGTQTWSELCTFSYTYPKQAASSPSAYFKSTVTAGKNAGC